MKKTVKKPAAKYLARLEETEFVVARISAEAARLLGRIARETRAFTLAKVLTTGEVVLIRQAPIRVVREYKNRILFDF